MSMLLTRLKSHGPARRGKARRGLAGRGEARPGTARQGMERDGDDNIAVPRFFYPVVDTSSRILMNEKIRTARSGSLWE